MPGSHNRTTPRPERVPADRCCGLYLRCCCRWAAIMLRSWMEQHGQGIRKSGGIAPFPNVRLETKRGLTLASGVRSAVTAVDVARCREHELTFSHGTGRVLYHLNFRIQYPEPVASHQLVEAPVGSQVRCEPSGVGTRSHSQTQSFAGRPDH